MTLDVALELSKQFITVNKLGFTPAAVIKQKGKLPIYTFDNTNLHYVLKSQAGEGGYDSDRFTAKWKLRRSDSWQPRLREDDLS